jgi:pimeloyl-ACP methyl ester carboxylesterase
MGSPTPVFEGLAQAGEVALFVRQFGVAGPRLVLLHGEQDMRFPVSVARQLHQAVPQSQLVVLPETGHLAHIERTDDWNNAVRAFLQATAP